jgi:peptidoglycan hydrolase CwlO-like protein
MNLVGKIFTVLILVMAMFFLGLTVAVYATHKNWMRVVDNSQPLPGEKLGLKQELQKAEDRNKELTDAKARLERTQAAELAAAEQVRGKLETENDKLKRERKGLEEDLAKQTQDVRDAVAALNRAQDETTRARKELEGLRTEVRQAQKDRDDHFKEVVRVTDEMNQTQNEVSRLKALNTTLTQDLAKAKEVLGKFGLKPEPELYVGTPPKDLDGVVTGVTGDGTVQISLGEDAGLLPKHRMEVYRIGPAGNTYVGRIEVVRVAADAAVCKIIPEFMKSTVQQGDRVASNL